MLPREDLRVVRDDRATRIFISSVRRGLESERDSLPGLISALGHTPVRFEDFGSRPEPSRQACLDGVASSDAYLMLLGPIYGHRFPETNQSLTHDEFVAAQAAGIQRLVFRKKGVEFEPEQEEFAKLVGDQAEWSPGPRTNSTTEASLEVHVIPIDDHPRSRREMADVADAIPARLRGNSTIPATSALDVASTDSAVTVAFPTGRRRWGQPVAAQLRRLRLDAAPSLRRDVPATRIDGGNLRYR